MATTVFDGIKFCEQCLTLKEFGDCNFKFDENGRKFSKWVENTVGKGEIAHYEQFSFSLGVFKRLILQTRKNQGLFGKGLKRTSKGTFLPSLVQIGPAV